RPGALRGGLAPSMRHSFEVDEERGGAAGGRRGGPSVGRRLRCAAAAAAAVATAALAHGRHARAGAEAGRQEEAEMVARSLLTEPPSSCLEKAQKGTLIGAFEPQCQEDGAYAAWQCHGSTGYCWCSSASGRQVPGTLRGPSEGGSFSKEDCVAVRLKEEEKKEAAESVASSLSASGRQLAGTLRGPSEGGSFSEEVCAATRKQEEEKKEAAESVASSLLTEPPLSCSQLAQKAREGHLIGAFV
ncbi:unnamed protein product, partial [Prorocentrum cordatum]